MSNLTRYDPFSMEPVSDLFHGLFRPLRGIATGDDATLADMKLDVTENDTAYTVKAELPGVEKKDIDVKIDGNTEGGAQQGIEGRRAGAATRTLFRRNQPVVLPGE
jgi:HSP20 family molecular chaperone IbpA